MLTQTEFSRQIIEGREAFHKDYEATYRHNANPCRAALYDTNPLVRLGALIKAVELMNLLGHCVIEQGLLEKRLKEEDNLVAWGYVRAILKHVYGKSLGDFDK